MPHSIVFNFCFDVALLKILFKIFISVKKNVSNFLFIQIVEKYVEILNASIVKIYCIL